MAITSQLPCVAQWIELFRPKEEMGVQFPPGRHDSVFIMRGIEPEQMVLLRGISAGEIQFPPGRHDSVFIVIFGERKKGRDASSFSFCDGARWFLETPPFDHSCKCPPADAEHFCGMSMRISLFYNCYYVRLYDITEARFRIIRERNSNVWLQFHLAIRMNSEFPRNAPQTFAERV